MSEFPTYLLNEKYAMSKLITENIIEQSAIEILHSPEC